MQRAEVQRFERLQHRAILSELGDGFIPNKSDGPCPDLDAEPDRCGDGLQILDRGFQVFDGGFANTVAAPFLFGFGIRFIGPALPKCGLAFAKSGSGQNLSEAGYRKSDLGQNLSGAGYRKSDPGQN